MYHLSRTLCDVLHEMRTMDKVKNYSSLLSLIEEVQIMGNRMEAGLDLQKDIRQLHEERKKLQAEVKKLKKQKEKLDESNQETDDS
jgi:cell division protein FtsB